MIYRTSPLPSSGVHKAHMKMAGRFISATPAAAFAACSLFFAPDIFAQEISDSLGELLVKQIDCCESGCLLPSVYAPTTQMKLCTSMRSRWLEICKFDSCPIRKIEQTVVHIDV